MNYLIYRQISSSESEYLGSTSFREIALDVASSVPCSFVLFDYGSLSFPD